MNLVLQNRVSSEMLEIVSIHRVQPYFHACVSDGMPRVGACMDEGIDPSPLFGISHIRRIIDDDL